MELRPGVRIHIVGIGGAGTSGLARILTEWGLVISGSDQYESPILEGLRQDGLEVHAGHHEDQVPEGAALVVHSLAIPLDNPEIAAAIRRGIPTIAYPPFLGRIAAQRRGIAVAGTHGKTSTAAMLLEVFVAADRDPSALIGGALHSLGGNHRCGAGPDFILEACEYQRSFHNFHPHFGIVTNVERDHPDVYPDDASVVSAFSKFVGGFRPGGIAVVHGDSWLVGGVDTPPGVSRVTFGFEEHCDWRAVILSGGAHPTFAVFRRGKPWGEVKLQVPGRHSISNALGVTALAAEMDLPQEAILEGLARFSGVDRRFHCRGSFGGVELVDDYAHHPTEVESVIHAAREAFPERRLWALFQPHQLGRLNAFGSAFAESLARADRVGLLPAYSVRERRDDFPQDLMERLEQGLHAAATPVHRFGSLDDSVERLPEMLEEGDVCLVLGAGDVFEVTPRLGCELEARLP